MRQHHGHGLFPAHVDMVCLWLNQNKQTRQALADHGDRLTGDVGIISIMSFVKESGVQGLARPCYMRQKVVPNDKAEGADACTDFLENGCAGRGLSRSSGVRRSCMGGLRHQLITACTSPRWDKPMYNDLAQHYQ